MKRWGWGMGVIAALMAAVVWPLSVHAVRDEGQFADDVRYVKHVRDGIGAYVDDVKAAQFEGPEIDAVFIDLEMCQPEDSTFHEEVNLLRQDVATLVSLDHELRDHEVI